MDDIWKWVTLWVSVAIIVAGLITTSVYIDYKKETRMAELGYQRVVVMGMQTMPYQKVH